MSEEDRRKFLEHDRASLEEIQAETIEREAKELVPVTVFITPKMRALVEADAIEEGHDNIRQHLVALMEETHECLLHGGSNCDGNWWCAVGLMQDRAAALHAA